MAANYECDISRNGTSDNPADNKINIRLTTERGVIHLEIPAPGIVAGHEDHKVLRDIAEDALAKLREAIATKLPTAT